MTEPSEVERALVEIARDLAVTGVKFALVGGLAVSVRAEIRFTRDVDVAVPIADDAAAESLVFALGARGYRPVASVEHETVRRLATARLLSRAGVKVDLLFASSGIEAETVGKAEEADFPNVGLIPVARAEELLAMKVLSMTDQRLQDRLDAQRLLLCNPALDLGVVREDLRLIQVRGFDRGQDLQEKLAALVREVRPG